MMYTFADLITITMQIGTIILMGFVFYTVLQVARVIREEMVDRHEQRFERWYNERVKTPKYPTKE